VGKIKPMIRLVALSLSIALLGAACGGSGAGTSGDKAAAGTSTTTANGGAMGDMDMNQVSVDSGAPGLDATLTSLLESHVYLASAAVLEAKLTKSTTSPEFKAAAAALDTNTVDLSKAIASVYGDAAGKQFLSLWRKHIGFFVDYAVGRLTGNMEQENKAKTNLQHYKKDFAAFLAKATGGKLPANAAAASLQAHVNSLIEVINSVIDGKGDPFALLYVAANHHMPMTATALAGAIIKQYPSKFPTS
jgi:hypothetical protein